MYVVDIGQAYWLTSKEILNWCEQNISPEYWGVEYAIGVSQQSALTYRYASKLYIHREEDAVYLRLRWLQDVAECT